MYDIRRIQGGKKFTQRVWFFIGQISILYSRTSIRSRADSISRICCIRQAGEIASHRFTELTYHAWNVKNATWYSSPRFMADLRLLQCHPIHTTLSCSNMPFFGSSFVVNCLNIFYYEFNALVFNYRFQVMFLDCSINVVIRMVI